MKKTRWMMAVVGLGMIPGCARKMSEHVYHTESGLNGGFEYSSNGTLPDNWLIYTPKTTGKGDFDVVLDSLDFAEGKRSLKFVVRECAPDGGRFSPGMARELDVTPGMNYRIRFWVKNEGAEFRIKMHAVSAHHGAEGLVLQSSETIMPWKSYEYQYRIPETMSKLRFEAGVLKPGVFGIDGIEISQAEEAGTR